MNKPPACPYANLRFARLACCKHAYAKRKGRIKFLVYPQPVDELKTITGANKFCNNGNDFREILITNLPQCIHNILY